MTLYRPKRNDHVRSVLMTDGYLVLYNLDTEWANTLNTMGALVWEFSDGEHNIEQIADEITNLVETYDRTQLMPKIEEVINELESGGFLTKCNLTND